MRGLKKIVYIFWGQFLASLSNKRVWVGYLIGIAMSLKSAYLYHGYAGDRVFQVFEPYVIQFMTLGNVTLMLIGFMIIISDAPFVNNRSTLALYRTSRGQWFWGMSTYIGVHGVLYYLVSLIATMIFSMRQGYVHNLWSRPMDNLARFPSMEAIEKWQMPTPSVALVTDYQPTTALCYTLILILMYSLILAVVIFIFNAVFSKAVGTVIAAAIHVIGWILMFDGFSNTLGRWSLFYNSIFLSHLTGNVSLITSLLYLLLVLCILLFIGPSMMHRVDFKHSSGEKNE